MHEIRIAFPFGLKIDTFRHFGGVFSEIFGCAAVRCWPNGFIQLDELAPEILINDGEFNTAFELSCRDAQTFLSPTQSAVFAVKSDNAWTKVLLSSARHSEFSAILIPLNMGQATMKEVFFHEERFPYSKSLTSVSEEVNWIVTVGLVNDQHEAFVIFVRQVQLAHKLKSELSSCADLLVS
jgi:hypothetical protein